jgi:hypothetical protein
MSLSRDMRLEVVLTGIDRLTKPLRNVLGASQGTSRGIKALRDRLKELDRSQKTLEDFKNVGRGLAITRTQLGAARDKLAALKAEIAATPAPTKQMAAALRAAQTEVQALGARHGKLVAQNVRLKESVERAGLATQHLTAQQRALKGRSDEVRRSLEGEELKLKAVANRMARVHAARAKFEKVQRLQGRLGLPAFELGHLRREVLQGLHAPLDEIKAFQTETQRIASLGLGEHVNKDAIAYAKGMKTYGTSTRENLELMRDAMTIFGDAHHAELVAPTLAKMKFANRAMFGDEHAEDSERKLMDMLKVIEMRDGLKSEHAFKSQADLVQRVITATGGRVSGSEWLDAIKTGGIAVKGMSDKSLYYQMEPLVQVMGGNRFGTATMSAYQNLYQGKTTKRSVKRLEALGLIGDESKVQHDKSGQISFLNPGALKGAELFRKSQFEWMEQVLLPALAEKGITTKDQVIDAIGGIFSNRTAASLFSHMYEQRGQIHKNAKLNEGAASIDELETRAKGTARGAELDLAAKRADLYNRMGEAIMPTYTRALELATTALQGLTAWMERNPTATKAIVISLAGLAAALGVIATVLGPLMLLNVGFTMLGANGGIATGALKLVGQAVLWLGRALLMNPIGLAITAIGVAAYLIYQYWDPIKAWFAGLWGEVKTAFSGGISGIGALILNWSPLGLFYRAFAAVLGWFGVELPGKFSEFGANLLAGLVRGITGALGTVKSAITGAADSVVGWFKEKLGIHSPSRVFAELGGYTMAGLDEGLTTGQRAPLGTLAKFAGHLTTVAAGIALTAPTAADIAIDSRPPVTARPAATAPAAAGGNTYTFHIHAAPGMDVEQLARLVQRKIADAERAAGARTRSRLADPD